MNQLQKYAWLIDTIRRAGKITHRELSERWQSNKELSGYKKLHRATFNRWRDAIFEQFGIIIDCQKVGGYLYFIANPEDIDENKLKKWMLDSVAVGNIISENMSLKNRILVDEIPSGREHLTTILAAMKENRVVDITYHPFYSSHSNTFPIEPYCVKLFENRWYVVAHNNYHNDIRIYGLDRVESAEVADETFRMPKDFDAADFFSTSYGIIVDDKIGPERIVVRAYDEHKHYMISLPLHHSQQLIEDCEEYADFELFLSPTYDFIMKLLQAGAMIEVLEPPTLREDIKRWISDMHGLYNGDDSTRQDTHI